ncbi:MAG: dGTP triphosphohydrolase [Gilvibacter sp.]
MNWEQLLSLKRHGDTHKRLRAEQDETRLGFEVDFDRIIFSQAFRSLQDKTQVIPLSKTNFVHTRLTHSLEVSVVGRSLGRLAGKAILDKHPHLQKVHGYTFNDFGAIVAAASLAHDIGNPPFGHSGEKAIGEFFSRGGGLQYKSELTANQFQDLIDYEGNANGFRILTEDRPGIEGGLRLSYATLGAFMKYPKGSLPKRPSDHICDKKFGVFDSDTACFKEVATELGLEPKDTENNSYYRHPLAYLVEAADDICYTIIDFEDGINLGLIEEEMALEYLINLVRDTIQTKKYAGLQTTKDRLAYLRALAINTLIAQAVKIFVENESKILSGQFETSLLDKSKFVPQIDDIIQISVQKIYKSKEVISKEIAGYSILATLLEAYTTAIVQDMQGKASNFDSLLLSSLKAQVAFDDCSLYERLMLCCSYVASLTDGNALDEFKQLQGHIS